MKILISSSSETRVNAKVGDLELEKLIVEKVKAKHPEAERVEVNWDYGQCFNGARVSWSMPIITNDTEDEL